MDRILNLYIKTIYPNTVDFKTTIKIKTIIEHLLDNNFDDKFILNYLIENGPSLKECLWKDSLLKKDAFYYHNKLRITPKSSIWNVNIKEKSNKFYLEMKIDFKMSDLLEYYYTTLNIPVSFRDYKRDSGAFRYMLNKKYLNNLESIDFVLTLIDYNKENENDFLSSPFDLKYQKEVYNKLNYIINNSKYNKIIWRNYNDM